MRHEKFKFTAILLLVIGLTSLQAQTGVNTSGGNASGSEGSASYTAGQVAYQTHTGTSGTVAEGVQQPYVITELIGLEETQNNFSVSIYPNPTTDFLRLKVRGEKFKNLSIQLYTLQGKRLQNKINVGRQTRVFMGNYLPGTYFLKVFQGKNEIKAYKIIKN